MATRHVLSELLADWQACGGVPVELESVGGVEAARRIRAGEHFDLVFLAADAIAALAAEGHVLVSSTRALMRSSTALAVPAGQPRPVIDSAAAVRAAVQAATAIGYSTGPSGQALQRLCERWGLADWLRQHGVQAPAGVPVATLLADGRATLGFQQLSELLDAPGIDIVGTLPAEIAIDTDFAAAIGTGSSQAAAATALLTFLASPQADALKHRHGMQAISAPFLPPPPESA